MAFDLKRVLKVMLFATNGPLSVKDIQTAISRFHDQATNTPAVDEAEGEVSTATGETTAGAAANDSTTDNLAPEAGGGQAVAAPSEAGEVPLPLVSPQNSDLYAEVPTLVTTTQIREAMDAITDEMRAADSDVVVMESSAGWRLATHPRYALWVRLLRNEPPPVRLTASALETLAVIAYRQPVTRAEIEQIRGVSAEAGVSKLLERDLVYVVGRADQPGRPLQFGTTDAFLEFVGIKSLDELPASDVLSPRQIDAWLQTSANPPAATDADMGLDETEVDQLTLDNPGSSPETDDTTAPEAVESPVASPEAAESAPTPTAPTDAEEQPAS